MVSLQAERFKIVIGIVNNDVRVDTSKSVRADRNTTLASRGPQNALDWHSDVVELSVDTGIRLLEQGVGRDHGPF